MVPVFVDLCKRTPLIPEDTVFVQIQKQKVPGGKCERVLFDLVRTCEGVPICVHCGFLCLSHPRDTSDHVSRPIT
jgi:hypothetical protein